MGINSTDPPAQGTDWRPGRARENCGAKLARFLREHASLRGPVVCSESASTHSPHPGAPAQLQLFVRSSLMRRSPLPVRTSCCTIWRRAPLASREVDHNVRCPEILAPMSLQLPPCKPTWARTGRKARSSGGSEPRHLGSASGDQALDAADRWAAGRRCRARSDRLRRAAHPS